MLPVYYYFKRQFIPVSTAKKKDLLLRVFIVFYCSDFKLSLVDLSSYEY